MSNPRHRENANHAVRRSPSGPSPVAVPPFILDGMDIREGEMIGEWHVYNGNGCSGQNLSPDLRWSHAPARTRSFAITLFDPDARSGLGRWHWLLFDVPPTVFHLPTGVGDPAHAFMPAIRHGMTDFGRPGYVGPCPPKGESPHRYLFTVHALDVDKLGVAAGMTAENLGLTIYAQALASATLTATYGR